MKKKNVLMMAMSLVLVAVIAVGGTLAYLTSETKTLTNTFTVGGGYPTDDPNAFYLDETAKDGEKNPGKVDLDPEKRTREDITYAPMTVGDAIAKDPTFHLTEGPESYVFAKVTGVDKMIKAGFIVSDVAPEDGLYLETMVNGLNANWVQVEKAGLDATYDGYYVYKVKDGDFTVTPGTDNMNALFQSVSIDKADTSIPTLIVGDNDTIVIKGIAMQADNFDDYKAAWTALKGQEGEGPFFN